MAEPLEEHRLAFLNALNESSGVAEAITYLDAGGDINAAIVPVIEHTLLHYAAIYRQLELIELLAERGADLEVCDAFGMSALHLATQHEIDAILMQTTKPVLPCSRRLAELGASLDALDNLGRTPRDVAKVYGPPVLDLFDEVMQ
jgi:hypothetical protein